MTVTREVFIVMFPEFADTAKYSADMVNLWLAQALLVISKPRFGSSYSLAVMLYVAHNLALGAISNASGGAASSAPAGILSSKTVGPLNRSYDTTSVAIQGAGEWNLTTYGQRLWRLMKGAVGPTYVPGAKFDGVNFPWPV